jgi:hypothetical protein
MGNEKEKVISRIELEIEKIRNKKSRVLFFVIDTKGNPNGALAYIYELALILSNDEYDVGMLYQAQDNEEFVGVREWLGDEYADLPHSNIGEGDVEVSASDILFIPELFSNIMMQTKKLPCKRIAILQNYDFILEQTPMSAQWGDFGIMEAVCNTEINADLVKEIFPYVRTTVIDPFVDKAFGETSEPKKLIVNILTKDQSNINRVIKPFYWKYPMYKFVSFRDLRGFPRDIYANLLREAAITIWIDEDASFGKSALEALKSGSIVISKQTEMTQEWMQGEEDGLLTNACVWFDSFQELPKIIASVVRAEITDSVPSEIKEEAEKALSLYSYEKTRDKLLSYVKGVLDNRIKEMESLEKFVETKESEEVKDGE